jgi:hypothetical protein
MDRSAWGERLVTGGALPLHPGGDFAPSGGAGLASEPFLRARAPRELVPR